MKPFLLFFALVTFAFLLTPVRSQNANQQNESAIHIGTDFIYAGEDVNPPGIKESLSANTVFKSTEMEYLIDSVNTYSFTLDGDSSQIQHSENVYNSSGLVVSNQGYIWNDFNAQFRRFKNEITYNTNGMRTATIYYSWNEESMAFDLSSRITVEYNPEGIKTNETYSDWHPENDIWEPTLKYEFENESNENGFTSKQTEYNWNSTEGTWMETSMNESSLTEDENGSEYISSMLYYDDDQGGWVGSKGEYLSNAKGFQYSGFRYSWDRDVSDWIMTGKSETAMDENSYPAEKISWRWDYANESLIYNYKEVYDYSTDGLMLSSITSYWNSSTEEWYSDSKAEYTYDENGFTSSIIQYKWDEVLPDWEMDEKTTYVNSPEGYRLLEEEFTWYADPGDWVQDSKIVQEFNAKNKLLNYEVYYKDFDNGGLKGSSKTEYAYLADGSNRQNKKLYRWNSEQSDWVVYEKEWTYYQSLNTGMDNINQSDLEVYPNPFNNEITFSTHLNLMNAHLMIYDSNGKMILTKTKLNNAKVSLHGLDSGVYFYRLMTEGKEITGKLLKK
ncbi:T9SS type A sorting domain-containing protein [Saccharicrinis sp. FJH54]|uniref:T9SS type A sorting domain-containing protein n=1 Tax=Saccharicrinis sp. FJH54 TaxID=3344665 RepID=UPI0035D480DA